MFNALAFVASFFVSFASAADLDKNDVLPPVKSEAMPTIHPIWTGINGKYPADGEKTCPNGTVPGILGTADRINGGVVDQLRLDWGRAWAVQPKDWDGTWTYVDMTITMGQSRENAAAIWCVSRAVLLGDATTAIAAADYHPPETTCSLRGGPPLYWDGLQVGEEAIRATSLSYACDGPSQEEVEVEVALLGAGSEFILLGDQKRTLKANAPPQTVEVAYKATSTEPKTLTVSAQGPAGQVTVPGRAKAREEAVKAQPFTPCKWAWGVGVGASISSQGLMGTLGGGAYAPIRIREGVCHAVHFEAGVGLTPARDGGPLNEWQSGSGAVASGYTSSLGYWFPGSRLTWELGVGVNALRVHPDFTSDMYDAGPRLEVGLPISVLGTTLIVSGHAMPGLTWGYAEPGAGGFSDNWGAPAASAGFTTRFMLEAGLKAGFMF